MRIMIDPGHGGSDPGGGTCALFVEKNWVLEASLQMRDLLQEAGYEVMMTRDRDKTVKPETRARIVRESGAEICISNHVNNVGNSSVRGLELFRSVHSQSNLAHFIADEILKLNLIPPRTGLTVIQQRHSYRCLFCGNRNYKNVEGVKYCTKCRKGWTPVKENRDYYYMHRDTGSVQTIIIEYGFASNPFDAKILHTARGLLIESATKGLIKYVEN